MTEAAAPGRLEPSRGLERWAPLGGIVYVALIFSLLFFPWFVIGLWIVVASVLLFVDSRRQSAT
jgi:hypothetical protein